MLDTINLDSTVPVYIQIENAVQFDIASGRLKAGDQLPSLAELGDRLGININTVAKAYRDLEVMGLVFSRRGRGVFINQGAAAKCRRDCYQRSAQRIHEVVAEAKAAGMTLTEVRRAISASYASEVGPYGPVPKIVGRSAR